MGIEPFVRSVKSRNSGYVKSNRNVVDRLLPEEKGMGWGGVGGGGLGQQPLKSAREPLPTQHAGVSPYPPWPFDIEAGCKNAHYFQPASMSHFFCGAKRRSKKTKKPEQLSGRIVEWHPQDIMHE